MTETSPFIAALVRGICADPLREKVLLAPSQRVARQWLDRVALLSGGVANVRAATLRRLILDYAGPVLRKRGLHVAGGEEKLRTMGSVMAELKAVSPGAGYFTRLPSSLGLAEMMLRSLEEMETARPDGGEDDFSGIASREKADELTMLLRRCRAERKNAGIAGTADIGDAALTGLSRAPAPLPLVVIPESLLEEADPMERRFLSRWPEQSLLTIPDDAGPCRAELFFHHADCVANEAREVLRKIQEDSLPLDRIEVLCLDEPAYAAALCSAGLEAFGGRVEDLPFTLHAGIPGNYSRPARLLSAWLEWIELDLPAEGLARMLEAGLLGDNRRNAGGISPARLAARLRELPINGSPGEYRRRLGGDHADEGLTRAEGWLATLLPDILPLANGGERLEPDDASGVLSAARKLLRLGAEGDAKLDAYARRALDDSVAAWQPYADWPGFNAMAWLRRLSDGLRVMGLGPQPGRLHIADIHSGGHSGRERAFILGMDDSRFPGGVRQDPVLLDKERNGISRHLELSRSRRERRERAMSRLLSRLSGTVFISYSRHDATRERELFPAALFTRLMTERNADSGDAVSLRPERPTKCLNRRDDWLHLLLDGRTNSLAPGDFAFWHPHLAAGETALAERASDRFTAWDGYVPEAGRDFSRDGWVLSPTHLEELAKCPQEFFFKRVLRIAPPDRYEPTPGKWLEDNDRGTLLHDLFQDFLAGMLETGERLEESNFHHHRDVLLELLDRALRRQRRRQPPRDALAYERERGEMLEACVIFLAEEVARQSRGRPLCLEAALGGAKENDPPWNCVEPVALSLPSGGVLRLQGRVDRIDRLNDHGGLVIWDYKTGKSAKFSRSDPFQQGRHLQPYLYAGMLVEMLRREGRPEPVRGFSYFFPMPRDEGRTFSYRWDRLREEGGEIVDDLAAMLTAGAFPFTTDRKDIAVFSEYKPLYGNMDELAARARRKAEADSEGARAAWTRLRDRKARAEEQA